MANVYSVRFFGGAVAAGVVGLYTVPAGKVAVVRDIVLHNAGNLLTGLHGIEVYDSTNVPIFEVFAPKARVGVSFHWEGHQVVNTAEELFTDALDLNWRVRISGYLLTLP